MLASGTFAFMRTPHERQYGNMVWVEGATRRDGEIVDTENRRSGNGVSGWLQERMGWRRLGLGSSAGEPGRRGRLPGKTRSISQESLRGNNGPSDMAIQMDLVTTVVVEEADANKTPESDTRSRYRRPSMTSLSVNGSEKQYNSK